MIKNQTDWLLQHFLEAEWGSWGTVNGKKKLRQKAVFCPIYV